MTDSIDLRPTLGQEIVPDSYRTCFGCGADNPVGLHVSDIHRDGDVVRATLPLTDAHQGFPGVLHGGVSASALDEVMGYACKMLTGVWGATAKMELRYRRPLPHHGTVMVEAGLRENKSTRRFALWSRIIDADGNAAVEAEALFVPLPDEVTARFA